MKLTQMFAAGLLIAGIGVSAPAAAQPRSGYIERYVGDRDGRYDNRYERRDDRRDYRRDGRRDHRWDRRNNGNHYGWRNGRGNRDCRIVYRHHQRVRVCR